MKVRQLTEAVEKVTLKKLILTNMFSSNPTGCFFHLQKRNTKPITVSMNASLKEILKNSETTTKNNYGNKNILPSKNFLYKRKSYEKHHGPVVGETGS